MTLICYCVSITGVEQLVTEFNAYWSLWIANLNAVSARNVPRRASIKSPNSLRLTLRVTHLPTGQATSRIQEVFFPKTCNFFHVFFFFRKVFVFEETFINLGKNMEQKLKESSDKLMLLKGHRLGNRIRLNLVHDGSRMTSASLL